VCVDACAHTHTHTHTCVQTCMWMHVCVWACMLCVRGGAIGSDALQHSKVKPAPPWQAKHSYGRAAAGSPAHLQLSRREFIHGREGVAPAQGEDHTGSALLRKCCRTCCSGGRASSSPAHALCKPPLSQVELAATALFPPGLDGAIQEGRAKQGWSRGQRLSS